MCYPGRFIACPRYHYPSCLALRPSTVVDQGNVYATKLEDIYLVLEYTPEEVLQTCYLIVCSLCSRSYGNSWKYDNAGWV